MLTELNEEQKALIPVVRDEWIQRCDNYEPIDQQQASEDIDWLYETSGLEKPRKLFVDSPIGIQVAANILYTVEEKEIKLDLNPAENLIKQRLNTFLLQ